MSEARNIGLRERQTRPLRQYIAAPASRIVKMQGVTERNAGEPG